MNLKNPNFDFPKSETLILESGNPNFRNPNFETPNYETLILISPNQKPNVRNPKLETLNFETLILENLNSSCVLYFYSFPVLCYLFVLIK